MDRDALRELAEQKEKEWRHIQEQRIEVLENELRQKSHDLCEEKKKFCQLKEDFKYNFKLLEERDVELEKHEKALNETRKQLSEKNAEISELKIKIDEIKKLTETEKNSVEECKKFYLARLNQKNSEIEKYKAIKDAEINQERSDIEKFKRNLKLQLQDLQIELEKQRNELKNEFDEIMRKREYEWRLQTDDFNTIILSKDMEIKMLKNELNSVKEENRLFKSNSNDLDQNSKSLERKLKEIEWELKDTNTIKEARIKELELKLSQIENSNKLINEDQNRKHEEMDKSIRDKEICIENLKRTLSEEKSQRISLDEQLNQYKTQFKQLNANKANLNQENDEKIARLNSEIEMLRSELEKQIEQNAKQFASKEINLENINQDLNKKMSELDYAKTELKKNYDHFKKLEHEKVVSNLEWKRKYEYLENVKAKEADEHNRQLIESRDLAMNQIKVLEDKLAHKENVIKALQSADPLINLVDFDPNETFKLKEENEKLKQIIKQMREDIETLAINDLVPVKQTSNDNVYKRSSQLNSIENQKGLTNRVNSEFEEDLKRQLLDLKQKNRHLQSQIDEFLLKNKFPENMTDNTVINTHIKSLNETITKLRKEKVDLIAFCKKQQTKLIYTEKQCTEQTDESRKRQTQIETLQYEMNSQARRLTSEINNLKQKVAHLELELSTTRREADEYHKVTIEKNAEISSLENKISELKIKLSTSGTQLNFGAQELFIQQLQDEIKRVSDLNQQLQIKLREQFHQIMREQQISSNTINAISSESCSESNNDTSKCDIYPKESSGFDVYTTTQASSGSKNCDPKILNYMHKQSGAMANELSLKKEIELLNTKLKTAAKFINNLIQEKEHLIEMSNQLRGELNRIKFENDNLSLMRIARDNENHLLNLQHCPTTPPHKAQVKTTKTALESKLVNLEKRQYELTKKQLAFAQRKSIAKSDPVLSVNEYKSSNYKDKDSDSLTISQDDSNNTVISSIKSENLREVWKILDDNENDSLMKSRGSDFGEKKELLDDAIKITSYRSPSSGREPYNLNNQGKSPMTSKNTVLISSKSPRPMSKTGSVPSTSRVDLIKNQKPKIRNYNIKD